MLRRFLLVLNVAFFLTASPVAAYFNPGPPSGFVNDFAGILDDSQETALESKLAAFRDESTSEIAVATISSLEGDSLENFALKLFEDWGIGGRENNNGLLLLIAVEDRKMKIETGYGLEGALPDATAYQIITKTLQPAFRENDYYGGLDQATDEMIAATRGEFTAPAVASGGLKNINFESVFWFLIFAFYILSALWRWLAKSKSWWQGGVIGALIGLVVALIFFQTLWPIFVLIIGGLGLLADWLVSQVLPAPRPRKGGKGIWFIGGPGGFGGRGGGGFGGGFGGFGGGRSGGGGASGGW